MIALFAEQMARKLFAQHLAGRIVNLRFGTDRTIFAQTRVYADHADVVLSLPLTAANPEPVVKDVLLHEVAHLLVGYQHQHDDVWTAKALALGVVNPSPFCGAR